MDVPTAEDVVRAHAHILARFGGERGILTLSPVHAALDRCAHGPFPVGDVVERAAFLVRGIAQDHPFADGNKRTAFAVTATFLRRNGYALRAAPEEESAFMLASARGDLDVEEMAEWLRSRLEKVYAIPVRVEPHAPAQVLHGAPGGGP